MDTSEKDLKSDYTETFNNFEPDSICRICLGTSSVSERTSNPRMMERMQFCLGLKIETHGRLPKGICDGCRGDLEVSHALRMRYLNSEHVLRAFWLQNFKVKIETEEGLHVTQSALCANPHFEEEMDVKYDVDNVEPLPLKCELQEDEGGESKNRDEDNDEREGTSGEKKFICDECNKPLSSKYTLRLHIHNFHVDKSKRSALDSTGWGKDRVYMCRECPYTTRYSHSLVHHTRTHTGERPYKCDECDKRFAQLATLATHKRTHTDRFEYTCDQCGKQLKNKDSYRVHKRTHSVVDEYTCNVCGKALKSRATLEDHTRRHFNIKNYSCETCGASFVSRPDLANHSKRHTRTEKEFACHLCDFKTYTKKNLDCHLMRHTGEKPFKCDICDSSWFTKGALKEHQVKHTKEKNFSCPVCDAKFAYGKSAKEHAMKVHGVKYRMSNVDRRVVK